jgi:hypothetical protein
MGDDKIVRRIFEVRTFKKRKKGRPRRIIGSGKTRWELKRSERKNASKKRMERENLHNTSTSTYFTPENVER